MISIIYIIHIYHSATTDSFTTDIVKMRKSLMFLKPNIF